MLDTLLAEEKMPDEYLGQTQVIVLALLANPHELTSLET